MSDNTLMNEETNREVSELLMTVVGERGDNEGAVDVVKRLIRESRKTDTESAHRSSGGESSDAPPMGYGSYVEDARCKREAAEHSDYPMGYSGD